MPSVMTLLLVDFFIFFNIAATSNLHVDLLAQQAGGLDNEHHDQDKKYDSVRQLGRNVGLAQVLDDAQQDTAENFTSGREKESNPPAVEKSPSEPSSPSKSSSPNSINPKEPEHKPSVKKELQEIKQGQAKKKEEKAKQQERQHPTPSHSKQKKKKKQKGR